MTPSRPFTSGDSKEIESIGAQVRSLENDLASARDSSDLAERKADQTIREFERKVTELETTINMLRQQNASAQAETAAAKQTAQDRKIELKEARLRTDSAERESQSRLTHLARVQEEVGETSFLSLASLPRHCFRFAYGLRLEPMDVPLSVPLAGRIPQNALADDSHASSGAHSGLTQAPDS